MLDTLTREEQEQRKRFRTAYKQALAKMPASEIANLLGVSVEMLRKMSTVSGWDQRRVPGARLAHMETIAEVTR